MADAYGVMGNPIAHSRSPFIHARFAEQTGEAITYDAILVPLDGFADAVTAFRARGGRGLNVTVPFKGDAFEVATRRTPRAERAGALNTLWFDDEGTVHGDNTDGVGLVRDLVANLGLALAGRRVLLLGAGGAARGVAGPLLAERPARLVVANRTPARASTLAAVFSQDGPIEACGFDALAGSRFDLVVNATAAGLEGALPDLPANLFAPGGWSYDMVYGPASAGFRGWALGNGATGTADGVGMLVEQAAESFRIWRGEQPDTGPVIVDLRARLAAQT